MQIGDNYRLVKRDMLYGDCHMRGDRKEHVDCVAEMGWRAASIRYVGLISSRGCFSSWALERAAV